MEQTMVAFVKQVQATKAIDLARLEQIFRQHGYREAADGEHILVLRLDEIGSLKARHVPSRSGLGIFVPRAKEAEEQ